MLKVLEREWNSIAGVVLMSAFPACHRLVTGSSK
jgi:hypothetical protein